MSAVPRAGARRKAQSLSITRRRSRRSRGTSEFALGWGTLLLTLLSWQFFAHVTDIRSVAAPVEAALALVRMVTSEDLTRHILPSVYRVAVGYSLAAGAGILLGVAIGFAGRIEPWVRPTIEFLRAIPPPAILPLALFAIGTGDAMRIFVIAFGCLWPILLNSMDGARRTDRLYVDVARVSGWGTPRILRSVVFPASLPQIFAGLRVSLAIGFIMMVISEMIGASSGLGFRILESQRSLRVADTYAGVLAIGILGWAFNLILVAVENRAIGWRTEQNGAGNER